MRKLGTPGPTQLLAGAVNGSVMPSADGKSLLPVEGAGAFERWENCDTLISVSYHSVQLDLGTHLWSLVESC